MLFKLMLETAGSCMIIHQVGNNRCSASATLGFRNSARLSPENLSPRKPTAPKAPAPRPVGQCPWLREAPEISAPPPRRAEAEEKVSEKRAKTRRRSELKKSQHALFASKRHLACTLLACAARGLSGDASLVGIQASWPLLVFAGRYLGLLFGLSAAPWEKVCDPRWPRQLQVGGRRLSHSMKVAALASDECWQGLRSPIPADV